MELVLVRHAEPDWEPDGRAVDDPALTRSGRLQAERLADALDGERFDAVYASPLRRVAETIEPWVQQSGRRPRTASWLAELRLPQMEGKTAKEVQHFFEAARARELEQWWDGMPGGESFRHFYERVSSGIEGLLVDGHRLRLHEDTPHRLWRLPRDPERILIVAHEGTNAVLLSHLLGIEPVPWAWMRFSMAWAGICRLRATPIASGAVWQLERFNDVTHLRGL